VRWGLRDRALIGLMVFTFARVGAAIGMKVEDYFIQGRRGWVRLHEKGGKRHDVPSNHNLDEYLEAGPKGPLFRTAIGKSDALTRRPLSQADAYRMMHLNGEPIASPFAPGFKCKFRDFVAK
jgi:integrase/recombinase XerD